MDKKQIDKVVKNLKNNIPLINNKEYRDSLINYLKLKTTKLTYDKLMIMLGERETKNFLDVFRQGIAELLTIFFFSKNEIDYEVEQKLNSENDSNVDVLVKLEKTFSVNIEIKCPVIPPNEQNVGLNGQLSYRFTDDKEGVLDFINGFNLQLDEVSKKLGRNGSIFLLPRDNKIKDTLLSCQNKFPHPDNNKINCLLINTNNHEMVAYWDYLTNEAETGFFDKNSFVPHKDFSKVNAVILTNGLELNEKHTASSWDLEKCCIVIICNRFSENYKELTECGAFKKVNDLIPNQTASFVNSIIENDKKGDDRFPLTNLKIELIYPWNFK